MTSGKIYRALTGVIFMVVAAAPADAQMARIPQAAPDQLLPVHEVFGIVRSHGLDPLAAPLRYGVTYRVRAIDRAGRDVNVVIDARYGDVLLVEAAMDGPYPERRIAAVPRGYDDPEFFDAPPRAYSNAPPAYVPPNPPRAIKPTPRVATVPSEKRLPIPRPRPDTVAAQSTPSPAPTATAPAAAPPAPKAETAPAQDSPTKWKDEPAPTNTPTAAPKVPDVTPLE